MDAKLSFIILFAIIGIPFSAQHLAHQRFRYIPPQQGLSQSMAPAFQERSVKRLCENTVRSLMGDARGTFWGGTNNGLMYIELYAENHEIRLEIKDTGEGIDNEHRKKVFTQDFIIKKKVYGFGLHHSAKYMAQMGGKIDLKNNPDGNEAVCKLCFAQNKNEGLLPEEAHLNTYRS